MASIQQSGFQRGIDAIRNDLNNGKAEDVLKSGQTGRVAAVALGILTAAGGLLFSTFSLSTLYTTTGITAIFLIPAAAAFLIAHECYKITNIFDVIIAEASDRNEGRPANPEWMASARSIFESTAILRRLLA
jgi:hypothetical protein